MPWPWTAAGTYMPVGRFMTAGGKPSAYIARWTETLPSGSLKVRINPKSAVTAGARWKVDNGTWKKSGATISGLPAGTHSIAFKAISGWITPAKQNVTIVDGETALAMGTYQTLNADFTGTPTAGKASLKVQFTDQSTGPVKIWSWDFGDNSTSKVQNPVHIYRKPGTYTVTLTVKNGKCADTTPKTNYISICPVPKAAFSAAPRSGKAPLSVKFTDLTDQSAGPVTSWLWNFGDVTTSSDQNPSHTYATAVTYTVKLKVTGPGGSSTKTRTGYIKVQQESQ